MADGPAPRSIQKYVFQQLENMYPSFGEAGEPDIHAIEIAIRRTNYCVSRIRAFGGRHFDCLNSGHYATFLYYLSHALWKNFGNAKDATRVFLLNKALNGIDLFHEVEMPDVFLIGHTVGMVFAKASYGDLCIFHQGCTVGRSKEHRPVLEAGVILYPHSAIIGACHVRENTVLSPGVQLINSDTPGNCIVFPGENGRPVFKEAAEYYADRYLHRA